jgi:hypothetical protein
MQSSSSTSMSLLSDMSPRAPVVRPLVAIDVSIISGNEMPLSPDTPGKNIEVKDHSEKAITELQTVSS